jgi:hypothetical protein
MPTSCFLFISFVRLLIFFQKKIIQAENILKLAEKGFSKTVVESVADPRTDHQQKLLESLDGGLCLLLLFFCCWPYKFVWECFSTFSYANGYILTTEAFAAGLLSRSANS